MEVHFAKPRNADSRPTMTVIRDDGSTTGGATTDFFIGHDLTHYAVETQLGIKDAFFGLLGSGWDISSFAECQPSSQKSRRLPEGALMVEAIVGYLDRQRYDSELTDPLIIEYFQSDCEKHCWPGLRVDSDELAKIRALRDDSLTMYSLAGPGQAIALPF